MTDDPARTRFFLLSLTRLGGAVLLMLGLVVASGRFEAVPRGVGIVMVMLGAFGFALLPRLLARRWRSRQ
jgi:hypothetical protein